MRDETIYASAFFVAVLSLGIALCGYVFYPTALEQCGYRCDGRFSFTEAQRGNGQPIGAPMQPAKCECVAQ